MSPAVSMALTTLAIAAILAAAHRPLGAHIANTYASTHHLGLERLLYRVGGIDPDADQRWPVYLRSLLAFSLVGVLAVYALQRLQGLLPLDLGRGSVDPDQAWNTAISFVTNTNWQSYSGEAAMGHLTQLLGLTVQNFVSAAVGLAVAVALIRGFASSRTDRLGSFWVDLVRGCVRILLPLALTAAVLLLLGGVVQTLDGSATFRTLTGGTQEVALGPVASQEAIKELGTNGGGFFNANSAHPFENPTPLTNLLEILLLLLIPFSLPYAFGRLVGDQRQGYAVVAVMALLFTVTLVAATAAELHGAGTAPALAGAAMEGKEVRFGVPTTALFGSATTATSTGAVIGAHDSFTALGGGVLLFNMLLGEIVPGGVGSGLYGILVVAILAVFLAGLMVGRTPEYLGKRIGRREIQLVALYVLVTPALVLVGTAIALSLDGPRSSQLNTGPHGLTEVMYAFTSAANNNGSAFGGLSSDTGFYNVGLGAAMALGRFVPIVLVMALAGTLARQAPSAATAGTLPTGSRLFVVLLLGTVLIVTGLTYLPALALGPLAEGVR